MKYIYTLEIKENKIKIFIIYFIHFLNINCLKLCMNVTGSRKNGGPDLYALSHLQFNTHNTLTALL